MKIQRILALTKKEMKKTIRQPAVLFMIFLFPIVFVFAFGASFGGIGGNNTATYQVGIVNYDEESNSWSKMFSEQLSATKIINLNIYNDNTTAQNELSQGKMQALIIVPTSFSQSINSYFESPTDANQWINSTINLYLDKGSLVATQAIPPIIQNILGSIINQNQQTTQAPIMLQTASLVEVKQTTTFDFFAPGMFTFASIFLIMMVAQSFTEDKENGMMKRIRISPVTSTEFMTGQVLSYTIIAILQAAIVFLMTYLMGFKPAVAISSYIFAFILVIIFSISNVGFGLITAVIAKSSSAATGLSFLFVLPQMFLGTFVGASLSGSAQIAGKIVPSYYVTDALTSIFLRGATIASATILFDTAVVTISCIAILVVGIVIYAKYYKI